MPALSLTTYWRQWLRDATALPPAKGAAMTVFEPATPSVIRPSCPKCSETMVLALIEPTEKPGHERRTFECPPCKHAISEVVKYK